MLKKKEIFKKIILKFGVSCGVSCVSCSCGVFTLTGEKINSVDHLRNRKHFPVLSSYRNTSGGLGEREMLWEHEPQASVSTAFSSSPKPSRVFL